MKLVEITITQTQCIHCLGTGRKQSPWPVYNINGLVIGYETKPECIVCKGQGLVELTTKRYVNDDS